MTTASNARALVFNAPGDPLQLESHPYPVPEAGEVLVRVRCCTVCGSDLHSMAAKRPVETPTVLGHEILGEVIATGGVVRFWGSDHPIVVGDRVTWSVSVSCGTCRLCERGLPQKCDALFKYGHAPMLTAGPFSGGLADVCLLRPRTAILPVPERLSDEVAAPANCATATAVAALRAAGDLASRNVLVQGAGLLGLTAAAMAAHAGARVLVAEPDPGRRATAQHWGAAATADPSQPDFDDHVRAFTDGRGFDIALEVSDAPAALAQGLASLGIGGAFVLVGAVLPSAPWPIDPEQIVRRLLRIQGVHNYAPLDLRDALRFLEEAQERYPFSEAVVSRHRLEDHEPALERARQSDALRVAFVPET